MPTNTNVSHVSPLLSYIPRDAWFEGNQSDHDLLNYTYASYHATNHTEFEGASLAFSWWGTDIWVYGGYRKRLGDYQVTLDGITTLYEGYISGLNEHFDYVLFNSTSLPVGQHQIRITNVSKDPERPVLDVSHLVFQNPLEETSIIDHSDSSCSWFPAQRNVWVASNTSRATNNSLGAMEVTFQVCSGFILYGNIDETSGPVTVSVDGKTFHPLSPNTSIPPRTNDSHVLFAVTGLNEGSHQLRVENNPVNAMTARRKVDLSYGRVLSIHGHGNSALQPPTDDPALSDGATSLDHRTTVLAASFSALGFFFLSILLWRITVHARRKSRERDVLTARPFLARADALSVSYRSSPRTRTPPSSAASSRPYVYTHTHRSQHSYSAHAHRDGPGPYQRRLQANSSSILGEIDALRRTFSRMVRPRRPPPISITLAGPSRHWEEAEAYSTAQDPEGGCPDSPVLGRREHALELGRGRGRGYGSGYGYGYGYERGYGELQRRPTNGTSSTSPTVFDSMSVHAPPSPSSTFSPEHGDPEAVPLPRTRTLRVGTQRARRSSIEKPPRVQLAGSPVVSLPSSHPSSRVNLHLHAGTAPPPPPPLLRSPPGLELDSGEWPPPPSYRFLDLH